MKRLPLILLSLTTLAAVVFCLLWQGARRDHSDLVTLARSGAAETCTRFSEDQVHGDDGDYWGGVAAFRTFQQVCAFAGAGERCRMQRRLRAAAAPGWSQGPSSSSP